MSNVPPIKKEAIDPTVADRVARHRLKIARLGLKRVEFYVHPDDVPAVKKLVDKLKRARDTRPMPE